MFSQNSLETGKKAYDNGEFHQAISFLEAAHMKNPSDKIARDYLGQSYAQLGLWEQSAKVYEKLREDFPREAEFHFKYGGTLGMLAKESNSVTALSKLGDIKFHLKKALKLDPNHIEARWALLQLYLELPAIVGGSVRTSREYASQLKSISPVDGALAYGYIERELENYDKAEVHYKKSVELGRSVTTYKELAELYKRSGSETKCLNILEEGIEILNSIVLASVYTNYALKLNRSEPEILEILDSLNMSDLTSEEKKKLIQIKTQLN